MKKLLLIYPPFCTPASPPYSLTYLYSFLKKNCDVEIEVLDLNLEFHKLKFSEYQQFYQDKKLWENYDDKTKEYTKLTSKTYSENNRKVVEGGKPELFDEMLKIIKDRKADVVAFSIVYSSQAFYTYALMKELKEFIKIIGGPAVNEKLVSVADESLKNELELLEFIQGEKVEHEKIDFDFALDFSIYDLKEYFTPYPVIPLKTCSTCYYKRCTFCSHYNASHYFEYPLEQVKKTIVESGQKYFFLIDDMVSTKRLLDFADIVKDLGIHWTCQLRPTKDLTAEVFGKLRESGLTMIMWGVESGNDRILGLIKKGTNPSDMETVLKNSHDAGIKNIAYMMVGFPTETKDEFIQTINFLEKNEANIDLVSFSVFGLQKGTIIYNNPSDFGITKITEEERTVLEPKISYEVSSGMNSEEANRARMGYKKTIEKMNKYPKTMNFFREHMFCSID